VTAAAGEESAAIKAIAGSPKPAENVAHAGKEADAPEDEQENRLCVQPAVEKIAEKPAHDDGRDEDEGQLHGDGGLIGDFFSFLSGRRG
jgi:hypothetical protein